MDGIGCSLPWESDGTGREGVNNPDEIGRSCLRQFPLEKYNVDQIPSELSVVKGNFFHSWTISIPIISIDFEILLIAPTLVKFCHITILSLPPSAIVQ